MSLSVGQPLDFARGAVLTKQVYADKVEDMVPESDKVAKEMPFVSAEKMPGNQYNQPVKLTCSVGVTFNADGGAFTLNQGLAPYEDNAVIKGSEILVRDYMSYAMMQRALKGDSGKGPASRAFVNTTKDTFVNLTKGGSFFREAMLLYGGGANADGGGMGIIESVTSSAGTSLVVVITAASWATALWAGKENAEYDLYNGATKINTLGTAAARDNNFILSTVNPLTRTLTFTSIAGNVTAAASSTGWTFWFAGQRTKDMLGAVGACTLTGSLWGISKSSYYLWAPQQVTVGGQLTFERLMQGLAQSAGVGFSGTLNLHVSTQGWKDLCDDQAALVRHGDQKGGKVSFGYEEIEFYSQTGKVRIKPNIYMKNGIALGFPEGECMRVGSTDLTFEQPGYGKMIREMENLAAVEARIYTDQAFFCQHPGYMVYFSGITNSV